MNHDSLAVVLTLAVASIVVAILCTAIIIEVRELINNYHNRCKHNNRYFDGDTMSIRCSDCNKLIASIGNEMSLEEFINQ